MIPPWLVDGRTLTTLSRLIIALAALCGVCVALCLGRSYWAFTQIKQAEVQSKSAAASLQEVDAEIARAMRLKRPSTPAPKQACTDFQSAVQAAAHQAGAVVRDFETSPDVQVYLSKYTNDNPPDGWNQVNVNFSITGGITSVFETLGSVRKTDIPFEIDGMEITRSFADDAGAAIVRAQVQARVLMRS